MYVWPVCALRPGLWLQLPDVRDNVGCLLVPLQGAVPRSIAVGALELGCWFRFGSVHIGAGVGAAAGCRCKAMALFMSVAVCALELGCWFCRGPLAGCCCEMSMTVRWCAAGVASGRCRVPPPDVHGRQRTIWGVGAGVMLPTKIFWYFGSMLTAVLAYLVELFFQCAALSMNDAMRHLP